MNGKEKEIFDQAISMLPEGKMPEAVVLHVGCGMDSRALRVGIGGHQWYDVDFTQVIEERKKYYTETNEYHMISTDVREHKWMDQLSQYNNAIVIMEGVSMYVTLEQLRGLYRELGKRFEKMRILVDCYTEFAAKISKYKNPINDVGVRSVYGISQPEILETDTGLQFVKEHEMTPACDMDQLKGMEKKIFQKVYGGRFAKKMYRLYEYSWQNC